MHWRSIIAAVLIGGPFLGTFMGIAVNPTMLPPPEPSWHKARPERIYTEQGRPEASTQAGAINLTSDEYVDTTPTWKRSAATREEVAYTMVVHTHEPAQLPSTTWVQEPEPTFSAKVVVWPSALEESASESTPALDANAGVNAGTAAQDGEPRPAAALDSF